MDVDRTDSVTAAAGLTVAVAVTIWTALAVVSLSMALAGVNPWLASVTNVLVAVGAAPALWHRRREPVWRWCVCGLAAGVVAGWVWLLASALWG
ncbi:DUF2537 domain-containing protein [Speluncibacter jeojiensis]|uniref:DUF2537 domain-containing protein n=1 Tax=Speluncibacter jeojiensis TaxID=2710754 RepID=A0A9X4LZ79_9ACTN|nr:DUF2537 domain-containing protein [Corynebacteriales bacterium D3-21]